VNLRGRNSGNQAIGQQITIRYPQDGRKNNMTTRERILSIRLADTMKKIPEYAERLHLRFVMKEPAKTPDPVDACVQNSSRK